MVETVDSLNTLTHEYNEGDIVYSKEDQKIYKFIDGNWEQMDISGGNFSLNQYDLSKQVYSQFPDLTDKEILSMRDTLNGWESHKKDYYLLYSKELHSFTLFHKDDNPNDKFFGSTIVEVLQEMGNIIWYDNSAFPDTGMEIWLRDSDNDSHGFMLMNWDDALVTYHG